MGHKTSFLNKLWLKKCPVIQNFAFFFGGKNQNSSHYSSIFISILSSNHNIQIQHLLQIQNCHLKKLYDQFSS